MKYIAGLVVSLFLVGCSTYAPDAGHEIVLVEKPVLSWLFGHGGIDSDPVKTGRTFAAFTTDGVDVEMRPVRYESDLKDTMTSDGVPIGFHAIVTLQVTDSVTLVKNFGTNWYLNNVDQPFSSFVRQAVRKHGMNETAINPIALDNIDEEIRGKLAAFIVEKQIPVKLVTMTIGKANPPDAIKNQRVETAAQEQRANTEKQFKLAEDQRKAAEESRAAADNAYRQTMGLNPDQFVQLERIKMERDVCTKNQCTFIQGTAVPTFNIPTTAK